MQYINYFNILKELRNNFVDIHCVSSLKCVIYCDVFNVFYYDVNKN